MANITSQIKRNRQNTKRRLRNRNVRGTARSSLYQARAALAKNAPESKEAVINAIGKPHRIQPSLVSFEQTFKVGKHGSGDA